MFSNLTTLFTALSLVSADTLLSYGEDSNEVDADRQVKFEPMIGTDDNKPHGGPYTLFDSFVDTYLIEDQLRFQPNSIANKMMSSFVLSADSADEMTTDIIKQGIESAISTFEAIDFEETDEMIEGPEYDLLKSLFYNMDAILNITATQDVKVAARFVNFFLRRYFKFVEDRMDEARVPTKDGQPMVEEQEEGEINYLSIPQNYDTLYFGKNFSLFSRLITSPMYQELTTEFISELIKELSYTPIDNGQEVTYNLYNYVLQTYFNTLKTMNSGVTDPADTFVTDNTPLYVASVNYNYPATAGTKYTPGTVILLDPTTVDPAFVAKHME